MSAGALGGFSRRFRLLNAASYVYDIINYSDHSADKRAVHFTSKWLVFQFVQ